MKYPPLRFELKRQFPGYEVIQHNVIVDVLEGVSMDMATDNFWANDVMKFQTPPRNSDKQSPNCVTNKCSFMNSGQFASIFDGSNRR